MPVMETDNLTQKAVLWAANGFDDYGEFRVDAPIEISVRWEDSRGDTVDANGNTVAYDAAVVVDRAITVGSVMWLGQLKDLTDTVTKLRVVTYESVPDVKGRNFWRQVLLSRLSNTLPDLA